MGFLSDLFLGGAKHKLNLRTMRKQHEYSLKYAPKYHAEQRRQASEDWLGDDPVAANVLGAQTRATFGALREEGATIPEILGSAAGGGPGPSGAVLGDGPQQAAGSALATQMEFQMAMQERELATRMRIAELQFGPGSPAAETAAAAVRNAETNWQRLSREDRRLDIEEVNSQIREEGLRLDVAKWNATSWQQTQAYQMFRLMASMGVENVRAQLFLNQFAKVTGKDPFSPSGEPLTAEEFGQVMTATMQGRAADEIIKLFGSLGDPKVMPVFDPDSRTPVMGDKMEWPSERHMLPRFPRRQR